MFQRTASAAGAGLTRWQPDERPNPLHGDEQRNTVGSAALCHNDARFCQCLSVREGGDYRYNRFARGKGDVVFSLFMPVAYTAAAPVLGNLLATPVFGTRLPWRLGCRRPSIGAVPGIWAGRCHCHFAAWDRVSGCPGQPRAVGKGLWFTAERVGLPVASIDGE